MPPFAGFFEGLDIEDRVDAGILDPRQAPAEHEKRESIKDNLVRFLVKNGYLSGVEAEDREGGKPSYQTVFRGLLEYLAASPAKLLIKKRTEPITVPSVIPTTGAISGAIRTPRRIKPGASSKRPRAIAAPLFSRRCRV
jgi:hypothetical protein